MESTITVNVYCENAGYINKIYLLTMIKVLSDV